MAVVTTPAANATGVSLDEGPATTDPRAHCHAVAIGDQIFDYAAWRGQQLAGELIALDTETAPIVDNAVPRLALATVSDETLTTAALQLGITNGLLNNFDSQIDSTAIDLRVTVPS